jgi:hypothetical protein
MRDDIPAVVAAHNTTHVGMHKTTMIYTIQLLKTVPANLYRMMVGNVAL